MRKNDQTNLFSKLDLPEVELKKYQSELKKALLHYQPHSQGRSFFLMKTNSLFYNFKQLTMSTSKKLAPLGVVALALVIATVSLLPNNSQNIVQAREIVDDALVQVEQMSSELSPEEKEILKQKLLAAKEAKDLVLVKNETQSHNIKVLSYKDKSGKQVELKIDGRNMPIIEGNTSEIEDELNEIEFNEMLVEVDGKKILLKKGTAYEVKDGGVYFMGRKIDGADAATFQKIDENLHGKDKNYVYFGNRIIEGADPVTFEVYAENNLYGKDATSVYYMDIAKSDLDVNTFIPEPHDGSVITEGPAL